MRFLRNWPASVVALLSLFTSRVIVLSTLLAVQTEMFSSTSMDDEEMVIGLLLAA